MRFWLGNTASRLAQWVQLLNQQSHLMRGEFVLMDGLVFASLDSCNAFLEYRDGPPVSQQVHKQRALEFREPSGGVEVAYGQESEELVWI